MPVGSTTIGQPFASTVIPLGVAGQSSLTSGTPSPSASPSAMIGGVEGVAVHPPGVTCVPAGAFRNGKVSVRLAIQDDRGRLLEAPAVSVPIAVPEDQMERAMVSSWYHRAEMRLAAGPQRVAVVVVDEVSGVQSTTFAEIEIPARE